MILIYETQSFMLMRSLAKVIIASINASLSVRVVTYRPSAGGRCGRSSKFGERRICPLGQRKQLVDGLSKGIGPPTRSRQGLEGTVLSVCGRSLSRQTLKVLPPKKINYHGRYPLFFFFRHNPEFLLHLKLRTL